MDTEDNNRITFQVSPVLQVDLKSTPIIRRHSKLLEYVVLITRKGIPPDQVVIRCIDRIRRLVQEHRAPVMKRLYIRKLSGNV